MSHALAVSAFPRAYPPTRPHPPPTKAICLTVGPMAKCGCGEAESVPPLGSVEQSWKSAQLNSDDLESPISPMIFRSIDEPGRYLDQTVDRSLPHSSTSAPLTAWHSSTQQAVSTKASIAALGLSRQSPTPNYDLLATSTWLNPPRGHSNPHIPPRSSSLPSSHCIPIYDSTHIMARPPTPSSLNSDCCSEMEFAEPSPHEAEYGSASKIPVDVPLLEPNPLPRTHTPSTPPRSSSSLSYYHSSATSHPDLESDDLQPFSLMGAGPGFAISFATPLRSQRKPRPKATAPPDSTRPAPSDSSLRLGFKRMKRLATRRSISSFDFLSCGDNSGQNQSMSASAFSSERGKSSESIASTVVSTPPGDDGDEARIVAHRLVGDVWEPQDLDQVIPALRSLKVSGKIGH